MSHIDKIRKLGGAGLCGAEIARELGISRQRVSQIARWHQISLPNKKLAPLPRAWPTVPRPRVQTGGISVPINHTVAGTISELLAAADLMARGYRVFSPIIPSKGHDLIAIKDGRLMTVEVRSASRNANGKTVFARKPDCASDVYALVVTGEPVSYEPPLPQ